jgi:alpha-amylase
MLTSLPRRPAFVLTLLLAAFGTALASNPDRAPVLPVIRHPGAGQIFYFVMTDRFENGSTANDYGGLSGSREDHGFDPTSIGYYHGGDFIGLTSRLDYIRDLGVTAIWITPPFRNKPVQHGSASYHGYWIVDFLQIDPHLGSDEDFRAFVREAKARGLKVYLDIVTNHTADVLSNTEGQFRYREISHWPYRDAAGREFNSRALAFNGIGEYPTFPDLDPATSFAYTPVAPAGDARAKKPAWLNDPSLYHNRGNSTFVGESSLDGDFGGLDDVFTEDPRAVKGFIEIYQHWIREYGIDGFRIDTAKHVNQEFWQAFMPAMHALAREMDRPTFLAFGEVADDRGDVVFLSEFSTHVPLDATLDFGFFVAARAFISRGGSAHKLTERFQLDDYYTDHDSNASMNTTFIGNHDAGRFAYFLQQDNPQAANETLLELLKLGNALMFLVRGQPVVYYGDEQGMIGTGNDKEARESMFASQAPHFRALPLLGTARTGADDKFDPQHPLYTTIRSLSEFRRSHAALSTGAMHLRETDDPRIFAFSRIHRDEGIEYVIAFNASRTETVPVTIATGQRDGVAFTRLHPSGVKDDRPGKITTGAEGRLNAALAPLEFAVWRAHRRLPPAAPNAAPIEIRYVTPLDGTRLAFEPYEFAGITFPTRQELRVDVTGSDGFGEVTFLLQRSSRSHEYEVIGVDDAPPFRVFWRPPADLDPHETLTFIATYDDLRGRRQSTSIQGLQVQALHGVAFGIRGSAVPHLGQPPRERLRAASDRHRILEARAEGTPPLVYQWYHNDQPIPGATDPELHVDDAPGRYRLRVHNVAGSTLSKEISFEQRRAPTAPVP